MDEKRGDLAGNGGAEPYIRLCPACGRPYDAAGASWCECITDHPTLVCPHCGKCFCNLDKEAIRAFWNDAPPSLWKRRLERHRQRKGAPPNEKGNPLRRPLILVADDNDDARLVAFRVLEGLGYGVLLARDGIEAYHLACDYVPDLVLTDQVMPHMDGKHLCRMIRANPALARVRLILMTGLYRKDRERIELIRESQADDFLAKPVSYERLGEILEGWLKVPHPPGP
jgi:CheY-like chemotaxis protein